MFAIRRKKDSKLFVIWKLKCGKWCPKFSQTRFKVVRSFGEAASVLEEIEEFCGHNPDLEIVSVNLETASK